MAKKYTIDLGSMLTAMDMCDSGFYETLNEEQRQEFSPWLAMRWASSIEGDAASDVLLRVNRRVNVRFMELVKHPELQWRLLASCGAGVKRRHSFIPPPKREKTNKLLEVLGELCPMLSNSELELLITINSKENIKGMLQDFGFENKEIKELLSK